MSQTDEVAGVLRKALNVLRERGLAKGTLCDQTTGEVCANGAYNLAEHGSAQYASHVGLSGTPGSDALAMVVEEQWPDRLPRSRDPEYTIGTVVCFNNHPDTTQDDVERAFEKAIARAEEMI